MTGDAGEPEGSTALTGFQVEVARTFFSLPAADRFLLAGGAALVAQHMPSRPAQDLDLFAGVPALGVVALEQVEAAADKKALALDVERHRFPALHHTAESVIILLPEASRSRSMT